MKSAREKVPFGTAAIEQLKKKVAFTTNRGAKRRTQESRTNIAKESLLRATVDVLVERGYAGLTTKEVSTRAGLSSGALVHHFASKAELVVAGTAFVYDEMIKRTQESVQSEEAKKDPLRAFIKDCSRIYFDWPFLAALEVVVFARTSNDLMPQVQPFMGRYRKITNETWHQTFIEFGYSDRQALVLINITLNMIRGMAVNNIWAHDMKLYHHLIEEWVLMASHLSNVLRDA